MHSTQVAQPSPVVRRDAVRLKTSVVSDPGPWLVLAAPISFALTLLAVIYIARISF